MSNGHNSFGRRVLVLGYSVECGFRSEGRAGGRAGSCGVVGGHQLVGGLGRRQGRCLWM